jgi:hypothetical protein
LADELVPSCERDQRFERRPQRDRSPVRDEAVDGLVERQELHRLPDVNG